MNCKNPIFIPLKKPPMNFHILLHLPAHLACKCNTVQHNRVEQGKQRSHDKSKMKITFSVRPRTSSCHANDEKWFKRPVLHTSQLILTQCVWEETEKKLACVFTADRMEREREKKNLDFRVWMEAMEAPEDQAGRGRSNLTTERYKIKPYVNNLVWGKK